MDAKDSVAGTTTATFATMAAFKAGMTDGPNMENVPTDKTHAARFSGILRSSTTDLWT